MIIPQGTSLGELESRQTFTNRCNSGEYVDSFGNCHSSGWYYYGRWVLAAIVIVFFILLFVTWSCVSNRRRRRRGLQPMYGTGWMPQGGPAYNNGGQQPQYNHGGWFGGFGHKNNNNNTNQPPPPQYTPAAAPPQGQQYTGQTFNSNEGYYGHHQNDVPLQQPSGSYYPRGGDPVYEPPAGPPPAKN